MWRCLLMTLSLTILACGAGGARSVHPDIMDDTVQSDPGLMDLVDIVLSDMTPHDDTAQNDDPITPDTTLAPDLLAEAFDDAIEDTTPEVAFDLVVTDEPFPPRSLPFAFSRPPEGIPPTAAETRAFTQAVTGLWKQVDWFRWILRTSAGVDPSTGKADFLAYYRDQLAIKAGDSVTFQSRGGEHNMWIPGAKVLSAAMGGYLSTGDWVMGKVAEQYCKGLTAMIRGFVWDEADPAPWLMARSIFPMDHAFTLDASTWHDDGRKKAVEHHWMHQVQDGWNAHTFPWPHNPTWGSIYVTNMRSKDDVCHIVRTTAFLYYLIEDAPAGEVRDACSETLTYMKRFNQDIVDQGYFIRTKGPDGVAYAFADQDLGNYITYTLVEPLLECPNRLASDLIAYGERRTNACGAGFVPTLERLGTRGHYYNYPIFWNYHMAALANALVQRQHEDAYPLLQGLADRLDAYFHPSPDEAGPKDADWGRDMAVLLVQAASVGLPLTAHEANHVQKHWLRAVMDFAHWPRWDLWAASVPDGAYASHDGFRPAASSEGVPVEALTLFLEYCNSPFRNPAGVPPVDCEIVRDMAKWGQN